MHSTRRWQKVRKDEELWPNLRFSNEPNVVAVRAWDKAGARTLCFEALDDLSAYKTQLLANIRADSNCDETPLVTTLKSADADVTTMSSVKVTNLADDGQHNTSGEPQPHSAQISKRKSTEGDTTTETKDKRCRDNSYENEFHGEGLHQEDESSSEDSDKGGSDSEHASQEDNEVADQSEALHVVDVNGVRSKSKKKVWLQERDLVAMLGSVGKELQPGSKKDGAVIPFDLRKQLQGREH